MLFVETSTPASKPSSAIPISLANSLTMSLPATCRAGSAARRLLRPTSLRQLATTATATNTPHHRHSYSQQSHPLPHSSSFYSHEHPPSSSPDNTFGRTERAILAAAYAHVPEHGFTHRALSLGARDAGLLDMSPSALVDGPFSLIRWHLLTQRGMMAGRARELDEGMGVGTKVAALTWARLMGNKDIIHRWQEVSFMSHCPSKLTQLLRSGCAYLCVLLANQTFFPRPWPSWPSHPTFPPP